MKNGEEVIKRAVSRFLSETEAFCRGLTQCDPATTEGRQKFKEQQVKEKRCTKYVEGSMRILPNITEEEQI